MNEIKFLFPVFEKSWTVQTDLIADLESGFKSLSENAIRSVWAVFSQNSIFFVSRLKNRAYREVIYFESVLIDCMCVYSSVNKNKDMEFH